MHVFFTSDRKGGNAVDRRTFRKDGEYTEKTKRDQEAFQNNSAPLIEYVNPNGLEEETIDSNTNYNLYHYAGNNPVRYVDPTGRENELTDDQKTLFKVSVNTAKNDIKSLIKEINSNKISDEIMQNAKEFLGRDLTNKADRKEVISGLKKIHKSL